MPSQDQCCPAGPSCGWIRNVRMFDFLITDSRLDQARSSFFLNISNNEVAILEGRFFLRQGERRLKTASFDKTEYSRQTCHPKLRQCNHL